MKLMEISLESYHILIALIYETSSTEQQSKLPSCLSFQSVEWNLFDVKYYQSEYQAFMGFFFKRRILQLFKLIQKGVTASIKLNSMF